VRSKIGYQRTCPEAKAVDIYEVWCRTVHLAQMTGPTPKQSDRTVSVAALDVGDADRQLGKALPQRPLVVRAVLPRGLEHLVRIERKAAVQQILGVGERFRR